MGFLNLIYKIEEKIFDKNPQDYIDKFIDKLKSNGNLTRHEQNYLLCHPKQVIDKLLNNEFFYFDENNVLHYKLNNESNTNNSIECKASELELNNIVKKYISFFETGTYNKQVEFDPLPKKNKSSTYDFKQEFYGHYKKHGLCPRQSAILANILLNDYSDIENNIRCFRGDLLNYALSILPSASKYIILFVDKYKEEDEIFCKLLTKLLIAKVEENKCENIVGDSTKLIQFLENKEDISIDLADRLQNRTENCSMTKRKILHDVVIHLLEAYAEKDHDDIDEHSSYFVEQSIKIIIEAAMYEVEDQSVINARKKIHTRLTKLLGCAPPMPKPHKKSEDLEGQKLFLKYELWESVKKFNFKGKDKLRNAFLDAVVDSDLREEKKQAFITTNDQWTKPENSDSQNNLTDCRPNPNDIV